MIIDPSDIAETEIRSKRTGETFGHHRMLSATLGFDHLFTSLETLPPGCKSSSPHYHTQKEEIIFILSGHPTVQVGGKETTGEPGQFICFIPGEKKHHQILNKTDRDCKFIVMAAGFKSDETIYF